MVFISDQATKKNKKNRTKRSGKNSKLLLKNVSTGRWTYIFQRDKNTIDFLLTAVRPIVISLREKQKCVLDYGLTYP